MKLAGATSLLPGLALLAGCGGGSPAVRSTVAVRVARAQTTHEYRAPAPPRQSVVGGSATRLGAVESFAQAYINWTADTVSQTMRELAARSLGQARSAAELAASETAADYELERGGIANSGTVEAVAALHGQPNRYVVVTRELTTATATTAYQGLQAAWHVAVATVQRLDTGQWVLSDWQPES